MRWFRSLLVAALACGTALVIAPSAGASVPAASSRVCASFDTLVDELDEIDLTEADAFDADKLQEVGDAFKKAAKKAPKKVKSALNTLGNFYSALGGEDSAVAALQEYGRNASKISNATQVFLTYSAANC